MRKKFGSAYGYFSRDGKEYIISCGDFGTMLSTVGSGYSWRGSAGQNQITRPFQNLTKYNGGKYFYIPGFIDKRYMSSKLLWERFNRNTQYQSGGAYRETLNNHKVSIYQPLNL